jgi:hypothetical protein
VDPGERPDAAEQRLAEKRLELRLRDLEQHGLVRREGDRYLYREDEAHRARVDEVNYLFQSRRQELSRLIYSTSAARARRLAEACKL